MIYPTSAVKAMVHGDDFVAVGERDQVTGFRRQVASRFVQRHPESMSLEVDQCLDMLHSMLEGAATEPGPKDKKKEQDVCR